VERRWTIALAGAGTAVVAAGLSVLLVVLLSGARPAAPKGAIPVRQLLAVPVPQLYAAPVRPLQAAVQLMSPFTGEPARALGRVVVVKIDNIAQARPPAGLASADIVYLLPVEGGLSRIFAVFSSRT
jgi:DUF3048 family protein